MSAGALFCSLCALHNKHGKILNKMGENINFSTTGADWLIVKL
jgi:hypothetical protein